MGAIERYNRFIQSILPSFPGNPYILDMLSRCQEIFRYNNLPDTIPEFNLEMYLQCNGYVAIIEHEGKLYAVNGGLGGEPDAYYMPTELVVANPALKLSKTYKIDVDCVIIKNDSYYNGILPLISRYTDSMDTVEKSMRVASINSRIMSILSASDERTQKAATEYIHGIQEGDIGVIFENAFLDGLRVQPYATSASSNLIQALIELFQFYRASMYNEIGLNANFNMKRERMITSETEMNRDALFPLIDNMLRCRQEGIEKVNAMFGTDISIDFASSWELNHEEEEAEIEQLESGGGEESNDNSNAEEDANADAE